MAGLIVDTNPDRQRPRHRKMWGEIRNEFNTELALGNGFWLLERQISVIRRSRATSKLFEAKLNQSKQAILSSVRIGVLLTNRLWGSLVI